ncbi:hypothetical protein Tco_1536508 [Tanacetum coccineum]
MCGADHDNVETRADKKLFSGIQSRSSVTLQLSTEVHGEVSGKMVPGKTALPDVKKRRREEKVDGMNGVLESGPWFILSEPIILKKWMPNASLLKED